MSKDSKASPAGGASAKTSRQKQSRESQLDPLQINYPQKMLDEEDFVGIKGMQEGLRKLGRRRSMTDQEKLAALRAILAPPTKTFGGGQFQIVDRASYFVEAVFAEIAIRQLTLDVSALHRLREMLEEAERILLDK